MQSIKNLFISALIVVAISPTVYADTDNLPLDKSCATVAMACKAAGYTQAEGSDKMFWQDCMQPILLGKTVAGVTVDPDTVKACRVKKISELKNEVKKLENVSKANLN